MRKFCTAAGLFAAFSLVSGTVLAQDAKTKLSTAECQSVWGTASAGGSSLSTSQAQPYVTDFTSVDTNSDGKLSSAEFLAGCQKGLVHDSASRGVGSGGSGADSSNMPASKQPY